MGEGVSHHEGGHPLRQLVVILLVFWNSMPSNPRSDLEGIAISSGRGTVVGDVCFTAISGRAASPLKESAMCQKRTLTLVRHYSQGFT